MTKQMRQGLFIVASVLVSGGFLWLVLRDVPLAEVAQSLRQANLAWVLASLLMIVIGVWTRGVRWRGLLDNRLSVTDSFLIMGITFVLNQLPFRAGEVARSILATRRDVPFMTAATSIVVERLLDTLFVVVLLAIAVTQLPEVPPQMVQGAVLFGVLAVVAVLILLAMAHFPAIAVRLLDMLLRWIPALERLPLHEWLEQVVTGLHPLTQWRRLGHALLWTLISWGFSWLSLWTLAQALRPTLGAEADLILGTTLGITLASLSIAIPVSIAGIGPFEAAIALAGQLTGMTQIGYVALGFGYHGIGVLGYLLVGVPGMLRLSLSLGGVLKRSTAGDTPSPPS